MSSRSLRTIISVDPHAKPFTQPGVHNRWHPDIPVVATVEPGEAFKVECMDFTGNFIQNNDCADDVLDFQWEADHHLSGPIEIRTAQPGDVLAVDILDVQPFSSRMWGFSLLDPGLGPLDRPYTRVAKSIWDFDGIRASSRHVPGVEFCGRPMCGVIGTAPSDEMLEIWRKREQDLNDRFLSHGHLCAQLPTEIAGYIGQNIDDKLRNRILHEGARTKPAREHGGNIDASALTKGSRIYLPVYVPGAKLSVGDLHFCQGDGEPTCAIEMAGIASLRVTIIKDGIAKLRMKAPIMIPSPAEPLYRDQLVFHGLSLQDGVQQKSNLTSSYIHAASNAMDYLEKFGFSHEQAYMLLATAPVETKVLAVPNIPHANVSVGLPLKIFDCDIRPSHQDEVIPPRAPAALLSEQREKLFREQHSQPQPTPFRDYV